MHIGKSPCTQLQVLEEPRSPGREGTTRTQQICSEAIVCRYAALMIRIGYCTKRIVKGLFSLKNLCL